MKKLLLCITVCLLVALCGNCWVACASEVSVSCKEAIVVSEDGQTLFEHNATEHRPIASMTKIMTLLCVYDAIDLGKVSLDDDVCVSSYASSMGGSQVFLQQGGVYKLGNLVKSVIVCSANDSCVALAEHICGSVESFVSQMNKKAADLGMKDTNFCNCTGLPAVSQFSCAKDVATMTLQLAKHPHYFECAKIWMEDFVHPDGSVIGMTNTNRLVRFYDGCDGGKTGFTSEAGHCLSALAKKNGMRVVAVVVGASDSKTRFNETSKLLNYAFANYENKVFMSSGQTVANVEVVGGKAQTLAVVANQSLQTFGKKGQIDCQVQIDLPQNVSAPVKQGDKVGVAYLQCGDKIIATVDLVADRDVERKSFVDYWKQIVTQ